jgi:uncharacterized protein YdiU (UPF0061 family)
MNQRLPPAAAPDLGLTFDHSYVRELPGLYVPWQPSPAPAPRWLRFNEALAEALGLDAQRLGGPEGLAVFSGQAVPAGAQPVALAYAGHQFGGFSPQLGDGRALLLGEFIDRHGQRHDLAFKGSGPTPFARGGDGKAAVGPVLREYLISEAMQALGIPTTRVLAAVATGETIYRDRPLPGAILTRTAASHLRVGSFQFLAARGDVEGLRRLLRYALARHDASVAQALDGADAASIALGLLRGVMQRQAALVARWMGVGFIHGVMNTDNMTLSGETIDYGPCAFMEVHDPETVFSSIDYHGRYAYGNQPGIAQWNLARLAEALLPVMDLPAEAAVERATAVIHEYPAIYQAQWLAECRRKLGLLDTGDARGDQALADAYLQLLHRWEVDHTWGFRALAGVLRSGQPEPTATLTESFGAGSAELRPWLQRWWQRLTRQDGSLHAAADRMDAANPLVIPRNHLVEAALEAASADANLRPFEALLQAVRRPFDAGQAGTVWARPATAQQRQGYQTFCGT